ncbi:PASTA domain-containing protein [Paenibacillus oryzisoli]|uniref:PASTA domain-containing protein n=1 Tax=Paenibacillus oryzisoli TaxID=1850517 RepID=UPI003D2B1A19
MPDQFDTRYVTREHIATLPHGTLQFGEDVYLNRTVLLYQITLPAGSRGVDYIQTLHHKAAFIHDGFHHILDTSVSEHAVNIVLQARNGSLLSSQIGQKRWTYQVVTAMISDLGVSLLDALEERITGFSVRADNLWLSESGKLSVLNYWDEEEMLDQGAIGLCRLMVSLLTRDATGSDAYEVLHTNLERAHIPSATTEQKAELVRLVKHICQSQASLSSLVFGLRNLPGVQQEESTAGAAMPATAAADSAPRRMVPVMPAQTAAGQDDDDDVEHRTIVRGLPRRTAAQEPARSETPSRAGWKVGAVSAATFLVSAAVVWAVWPSASEKSDKTITPPPSATAATVVITPSTTPTPKASEASVKQPGDKTIVPNLVGKMQAGAEEMALEAGLHYKYFLVDDAKPQGTVIRQDPQPGTDGFQGDNVIFWVSKGSP